MLIVHLFIQFRCIKFLQNHGHWLLNVEVVDDREFSLRILFRHVNIGFPLYLHFHRAPQELCNYEDRSRVRRGRDLFFQIPKKPQRFGNLLIVFYEFLSIFIFFYLLYMLLLLIYINVFVHLYKFIFIDILKFFYHIYDLHKLVSQPRPFALRCRNRPRVPSANITTTC